MPGAFKRRCELKRGTSWRSDKGENTGDTQEEKRLQRLLAIVKTMISREA
jgi:hypothetical protein